MILRIVHIDIQNFVWVKKIDFLLIYLPNYLKITDQKSNEFYPFKSMCVYGLKRVCYFHYNPDFEYLLCYQSNDAIPTYIFSSKTTKTTVGITVHDPKTFDLDQFSLMRKINHV